jgi:hypothetical protein
MDRKCTNCGCIAPEEVFESAEPRWSWHIVEHGEHVWQVVQVQHWPDRIAVENLEIHLSRQECVKTIALLRAAAEVQGRKLAYEDREPPYAD